MENCWCQNIDAKCHGCKSPCTELLILWAVCNHRQMISWIESMMNEWGRETVLHLGSSYSASETNVLNVTKQNAGKSINISHAKLHYLLDLSQILFFFPLHQTAFASGSITSTFEMQDTSSIMLNSLYSLMRSLVPSLKANFFAPWWLLGAKKTPKLTTMSMICTSWLNSASHLRHCASSVQI